jgi:nitrogen fixation NifU-like protein
MNSELEELYQTVILDHSKRPRNFGEIPEGAVHVHGDNPSCGDEIHLHVKFGADGGVEALKFTGQGCAISQASASMMTLKLQGKPRAEAQAMARAFHDLVTLENAEAPRALGDLRLLAGVRKFPQRVKCAMLAWRAFEQALGQSPETAEAEVSTEKP